MNENVVSHAQVQTPGGIGFSESATGDGALLVTVVIPVYNTPADLLERSVADVFAQTYRTIEVLIADDGSDAPCAAAVDAMAARDPRARALHFPHGGVSAARNAAIAESRGEWIAFVDADDEVFSWFVEEALSLAVENDADFVTGAFEKLRPDESPEIHTSGVSRGVVVLDNQLAIDEYRKETLTNLRSTVPGIPPCVNPGPIAKLFKTSLIRGIEFTLGLSHYEDNVFGFQYLGRCSRVVCANDAVWYAYYQHPDSHSHRSLLRNCVDDQRRLDALPVEGEFENSLAVRECIYALRVANAAIAAGEGFGVAVQLLRDMTEVGACFSRARLGEFKVRSWTRMLFNLARQKEYTLLVILLIIRIKIQGYYD